MVSDLFHVLCALWHEVRSLVQGWCCTVYGDRCHSPVTMGILNFFATWNIDWFTLIIVILIAYGLTFGKKEVKKTDGWMKRKFDGENKTI